MAVTIQFRRDTAAAWTSANPTLAQGELGLETDTTYYKIGNGSTAWNSLAYGSIQGAIPSNTVTSAMIVDGAIVNADINASAAIAYSKLSLGTSIAASDLAANAVTTAKILDANVTAAKLDSNAVTTAKILDNNVTVAKLSLDIQPDGDQSIIAGQIFS